MHIMTEKKMLRRSLLLTGAGVVAALAQNQKKEEDVQIAGATQDPTPRVGIVLSSFKARAKTTTGPRSRDCATPGLPAPT